MFRCEKCEDVVQPGTPTQSVVVQRRAKEYPQRQEELPHRPGRRPFVRTVDKGGDGNEIVRELAVCPECADSWGGDS